MSVEVESMNDKSVFRLRGDAWILMWVFGGMTLFFLGGGLLAGSRLRLATVNQWGPFVALVLLFALPGLFSLWWIKKTYVIADKDGLLHSNWRGRTLLRWSDISDYYFKKQEKHLVAHIEARGRIFVLNSLLSNSDELQKMVQEKAQSSRAKNWELLGTRTFDEWPRVFRYKDTNIALLVLASVGFTVVIIALQLSKGATYGGWAPIWNGFLSMWSALSLWGKIGFVFFCFASASCLCALFLAPRLPQARATKPHLQQTVTADLRGLIFQTPQEHIPISWDRVLDYYLEPIKGTLEMVNRCIVVTQRGEYSFLSPIVDGFTLREIVKKYATNAQSSEWKPKPGQSLDNLKAPAHLQAASGAQVFHFRTRTARALLLLFTLIVALAPASAVFGGKFKTTGDLIFLVVFFVPLGLATLCCWRGFLKSYVVANEDGLTLHGIFKTRSLRWNEIKRFRSDGYVCYIDGERQRLRYFLITSDVENLMEEIKQRAVNSENREWKPTG